MLMLHTTSIPKPTAESSPQLQQLQQPQQLHESSSKTKVWNNKATHLLKNNFTKFHNNRSNNNCNGKNSKKQHSYQSSNNSNSNNGKKHYHPQQQKLEYQRQQQHLHLNTNGIQHNSNYNSNCLVQNKCVNLLVNCTAATAEPTTSCTNNNDYNNNNRKIRNFRPGQQSLISVTPSITQATSALLYTTVTEVASITATPPSAIKIKTQSNLAIPTIYRSNCSVKTNKKLNICWTDFKKVSRTSSAFSSSAGSTSGCDYSSSSSSSSSNSSINSAENNTHSDDQQKLVYIKKALTKENLNRKKFTSYWKFSNKSFCTNSNNTKGCLSKTYSSSKSKQKLSEAVSGDHNTQYSLGNKQRINISRNNDCSNSSIKCLEQHQEDLLNQVEMTTALAAAAATIPTTTTTATTSNTNTATSTVPITSAVASATVTATATATTAATGTPANVHAEELVATDEITDLEAVKNPTQIKDISEKVSPFSIACSSKMKTISPATTTPFNSAKVNLPRPIAMPLTATTATSPSGPSSPNSYSLDFLHSVGVQMTGGANLTTLKTNISSSGMRGNVGGSAASGISSGVSSLRTAYNYSNFVGFGCGGEEGGEVVGVGNSSSGSSHRHQQRFLSTASSGGQSGNYQPSYQHRTHYQHQHHQHHHHHQPQQLTIASFMHKDLLGSENNDSSTSGGNSGSVNNNNYGNQHHYYMNQQRFHHNFYQPTHYQQQQPLSTTAAHHNTVYSPLSYNYGGGGGSGGGGGGGGNSNNGASNGRMGVTSAFAYQQSYNRSSSSGSVTSSDQHNNVNLPRSTQSQQLLVVKKSANSYNRSSRSSCSSSSSSSSSESSNLSHTSATSSFQRHQKGGGSKSKISSGQQETTGAASTHRLYNHQHYQQPYNHTYHHRHQFRSGGTGCGSVSGVVGHGTTAQHQNLNNLTYVTTTGNLQQNHPAIVTTINAHKRRGSPTSQLSQANSSSVGLKLESQFSFNGYQATQELHLSHTLNHHHIDKNNNRSTSAESLIPSTQLSPLCNVISCSQLDEATTTAAAVVAGVTTAADTQEKAGAGAEQSQVVNGYDSDSSSAKSTGALSSSFPRPKYQQLSSSSSNSSTSSSVVRDNLGTSQMLHSPIEFAYNVFPPPPLPTPTPTLTPTPTPTSLSQYHHHPATYSSTHQPTHASSPHPPQYRNGTLALLNLPHNYSDEEMVSMQQPAHQPPHFYLGATGEHLNTGVTVSLGMGSGNCVSGGSGYWSPLPNHQTLLYSPLPQTAPPTQALACGVSYSASKATRLADRDDQQQALSPHTGQQHHPQTLNNCLCIPEGSEQAGGSQLKRSSLQSHNALQQQMQRLPPTSISPTMVGINSDSSTTNTVAIGVRNRARSQQLSQTHITHVHYPQQLATSLAPSSTPMHTYSQHSVACNSGLQSHLRPPSNANTPAHEFYTHTPPDRFLARAHLVEQKEVPPALLINSKWDALSQGIWEKFTEYQQTEETYKQKMRLWRYLYIIIKNTYPRYGLYLVGSTISGFGANTSDVDMCLVSRSTSNIDPRMEALFNLNMLRECLIKSGEFENFNLIEAKVPILRFRDRMHQLEVDLNFNNCVGIKNTHLLHCYSQLDWRLRPLVLVTKLWAQYHNINNAKNMTISSYSLALMVIHFLQYAVNPPVLPCLHDMFPDKFPLLRSNDFGYVDMNESIGPYESKNTQTIGELFLYFLEYFSCFNYAQFAISIRTGGLLPINVCRQAKSLKNDIHQWKELCIEEPFDLTNTARSVYDFETFERVKAVFVASWRILRETLDLNAVFSPIIVPPATSTTSAIIAPTTTAATTLPVNKTGLFENTIPAVNATTQIVMANVIASKKCFFIFFIFILIL